MASLRIVMTNDVLAKKRSVFLVLAMVCVLVLQLHADNTHVVHVMKKLKVGLVGSRISSTDSDLANSYTTAVAPTTTTDQDSSKATMNGTKIFFVHVGKTGGTTLRTTVLRYGCRLYRNYRAKANCQKSIKINGESELGKQTTGIFHYEVKNPKSQKQIQKMDLLYVVREPIARFASSYEFINPHNCIRGNNEMEMKRKCQNQQKAQNFPDSFNAQFYYDCFPTVQAFLKYKPPKTVDEGDQKSSKKNCDKWWSDAFRPGRSVYGHMTANYQYYTKGMDLLEKDRKVWVIRTEHLWEDVSLIDTLVGGTGNYSQVQGRAINEQSIRKGASRSEKYVPLPFCCGLLDDMLAFRDIINRADNFNDQEKRETNERSWSRCNVTSWGMLETKCGGNGS